MVASLATTTVASIQNWWVGKRKVGVYAVHRYGHAWLMLCSSHPVLVAVSFITCYGAHVAHGAKQHQSIWNISQELFAGLLVPEFSRGFWLKFVYVQAIWACTYLLPFGLVHFGPFGLVHISCHLGLYNLGHLGLYIFVVIWVIERLANNYYYVILYWLSFNWGLLFPEPSYDILMLLPFGSLHGRQLTIIM